MVLGGDDVHAHLLVRVHGLEQALGGGAGGGHHVLALEVVEVLDVGGLLRQQAGADLEDADGEVDLLLALFVVGGGAALDVHGAVLHQRDAGLRGDQVIADLQLGEVEFLLHRLDHFQLQVVGVADRLARLGAEVGEGNRSVTVTEGDGAGFLDLLQRAGELVSDDRSGQQSGHDGGAQQTGSDTHEFLPRLVLIFIEPRAPGLSGTGCFAVFPGGGSHESIVLAEQCSGRMHASL